MSLQRLSFKHKLALSVSAIIIGLVAVVFLLIETLVKKYVEAEIEKNLLGTCTSVGRLIEERRGRVEELAGAVASDYLIRTILTDKNLDRVTRDDILNSVILPSYTQLKLLAVLNTNAFVRAISTTAEEIEHMLISHPAISRSLEGRPVVGYIPHEGSFFQIAVIPVYKGIYVRELIGVVAVGVSWSMQDLKGIRELSHAEIAFFDASGLLLSSGPPFDPAPGHEGPAIDWSRLAALPSDWPSLLAAGTESFMVVKIGAPNLTSPAFMVARSLDQQLRFLNRMRTWLLQVGLGGVLIGCVVSFLLALGISHPIHILQSAFRRVAEGDFSRRVAVRSRDEFAELATEFNRMQEGLLERAQMKKALLVAEELQRNLLPAAPPCIKHLDIAGASIYCNAIGGDFYDYIEGPQGPGTVRIVLGDVCGHGTAAALLMASSRALLRSRSLQPGPIERVVSDVNREISLDMKDSGQFLTLFFVEINAETRQLRWVRAGHDAAILYHPATDTFENLSGPGMALGIDADQSYTARSKNGLLGGHVLVVGTDGIWEARSAAGEMFGKERLYAILRQHAGGSAQEIADAMVEQLKRFTGKSGFEDDVTLVVVKFESASGTIPDSA